MSTELCLKGDGDQEGPAPPDPAASLTALSWCLRARACGYGLDRRERAACLTLLEAGIPRVDTADLEAAAQILRSSRHLSDRRREKAGELSVRLAECAEALLKSA